MTKEDLKQFVTKDKFDKKLDEVISAVYGLAKKFDNFYPEITANLAAYDRFEATI